jgi:hypothetical protein
MRDSRTCMLGIVFALLISSPCAVAADSNTAAMQADHSLRAALAKSDKAAAGALLDRQFAWTDTQGKTRSKAETLGSLSSFAKDNEGDADVKSYDYGQLGIVVGIHHEARLLRVWVKRPAGWRLFVDLDTPMPREMRPASAPPANRGPVGDCENPCRTVPYKPRTAADKAALAEWQKTKVDEWHPNAADWETHIADEFMIINNGSARNKPERVALAKKEQEEGRGAPGAPILSMNMHDFGNAVVMISHHVPYQGGKPYYNVRVFVNRDGHWPLVWSQQTTIQAAAPLPPVNAKH